MYLVLVIGCYIIGVIYGYPMLPNSVLPAYHKIVLFFVVVFALFTFYLACTISPGKINASTVHVYDNYPYDDVLYQEKECTTCKVPKLPRSKHCRVCDNCVPRFDHHCGWLNQCVGEENYKYFLLFVFSNACFLVYAGYLAIGVLVSVIIDEELYEQKYYRAGSKVAVGATHSIVFQYVLHKHSNIFMIAVLASVMGVALWAFIGYHFYLISCNTTTNESFKWGDVKSHFERLNKKASRDWSQAGCQGNPPDVIPEPKNIYLLPTLMENFREVFTPRYLHSLKDAETNVVDAVKANKNRKKEGKKRK
jgi:hypothetical protein